MLIQLNGIVLVNPNADFRLYCALLLESTSCLTVPQSWSSVSLLVFFDLFLGCSVLLAMCRDAAYMVRPYHCYRGTDLEATYICSLRSSSRSIIVISLVSRGY